MTTAPIQKGGDILGRLRDVPSEQVYTPQEGAARALLLACQAVLDEFPALDSKRIESVKRICRAAIATAQAAGIKP